MRRLIRDLKEIEDNDIPTVGISARPLENTMFIWHANIRGSDKTLYQGSVFHLEIEFDELYPHSPPKIKLFTTLPHPNVFGTSICLDMLEGNQKILYQGWTTAYSVQSILIQLQSFLFEQSPDIEEKKIEIK
jgi:ubiquitin-protein ligase